MPPRHTFSTAGAAKRMVEAARRAPRPSEAHGEGRAEEEEGHQFQSPRDP